MKDPVVQEIRSIRDTIAKEYGYDVDAIFRAFRESQAEGGRASVTLPRRKPVSVASKAAKRRKKDAA